MKKMNKIFPFLFLLIGQMLFAQMPIMKVGDEIKPQKTGVNLKSLNVEVEIFGNVATTTMTMVFHNSTNRMLEGELTFPMPEGVTVSRYAIDINGRIREAVPVPKAKATEVFESIEHRQVDPGLLEKVQGNNFRTRIYPLPANGDRTVVVAYEEELKFQNGNALQYHLPLDYKEVIEKFSLKTKVFQANSRPELVEQPDGSFSFSENGSVYEATLNKENFTPQKSLTINLPKTNALPEVVLQENTNGSYYFLANVYPKTQSRTKVWADKLGVIWDNSLSGTHRDIAKELELLRKIIQQKQNLTVEVGLLNITFKKAKTFVIKNGNWSDLKSFLETVTYDGGTDYSKIDAKTLTADEYILFSEGLSTFGISEISLTKPIYCINSSAKADYSSLKYWTTKTNGKFINLLNTSVDDAIKDLSQESFKFLGIKENVVSEVYPSTPTEVNGHLSVAGLLQEKSGELTLLFGYGDKVTAEQKVNYNATRNDLNVSKVWAQKKIAEMDIQYEKNKEDIEALGKDFEIVTRNTSLMVLESLSDYVRYEITPPAEMLAEYNRITKDNRLQKEQRINNLLQRAISTTEELKTWWNTDFKPVKTFPKPVKNETVQNTEAVIVGSPSSPVYNASPAPVQAMEARIEDDGVEEESDNRDAAKEVVMTRRARATESVAVVNEKSFFKKTSSDIEEYVAGVQIKNTEVKVPEIKLPEIKSDKAYIQTIEKAADAYAEYLKQRETYMGTPTYFFDVANYFYQKKDKEKALLILSSIADLDLENAELYKLLLYKLKEKEEYASELFIAQKIKEWRPMDPQSHRDYALALEDNGKYQQALESLYSILNASYSPESANRDYGIEEIIVTEINNLITLHKNHLKLSDIEKKIMADMSVEVRVVINWNKNDTDIDLWVTDPSGEKCFYSHTRTAAGGRISKDFTRGFGPEQFMLKKAIKGKYKIEANFFGERQLTLSGPTTIMAEIYLYYSDGSQTRKVITFQNDQKDGGKDGVLIGEFTF